MTTMFAILIMIDFMFLDDSSFVYDPDIKVSGLELVCPSQFLSVGTSMDSSDTR